ncbi:GNAT family N-acetyltransferase [Streptomyces radicis]|uniref:N-acetyltransferase n=1 Tax=Streptomyces radicis TaxID=1750517 RepID=A0A3A9VTL1_9ACTN|nr:N-acetyltransferase [Streptomyces radicis]RKN04421.1 N-acetyltransferase [Streptomyces radicis]RKN15189.1 N-acetyltransferase [Streptomyces radicis]
MTATTGLSFRAATEADVPDVVALVESAYRGDASRVGWTTEADILDGRRTGADEVAPAVLDPTTLLLLAESGGELVACCLVSRAHDQPSDEPMAGSAASGPEVAGPAAHFGMFAVRPGLQGSGLGRLVLAEAERRAADEWGARRMVLEVISVRDALIAWYERRGYARTGRVSPFPYGDERFGVPRRADLEFAELVKPLT